MEKIICISGKARSGKDTVGSMLQKSIESKGKTALITHYADLLKYICKTFFGWDGNKDDAGRELLQYIGSDVVRLYNPDYWVSFVASIISMFKEKWDYIIIPDCRFPNEVGYLRKVFGNCVVHIDVVRPGFDNGLTDAQKSHQSENAMDFVSPNYRFINDGSLDSLETYVGQFVDIILIR